MPNKTFRIQDRSIAEALPLRLVDNGDGTYSVAVSSVAPSSVGGVVPASGASYDAGPAWTSSYTHTASADMSSTANLTAAPESGKKIVIDDIIISVAAALTFTLEEETSGTDIIKVYLPANSTLQITPRGKIKLPTANKKLNGVASASGAVAVTVVYHSEA